MLAVASEKRTAEGNSSLCLKEVGGVVVRQDSVQQYRLVDNCMCQRGKDMERKGLEKGQENLDVFCLHKTGKKPHGRLPAEWTEV